MEDTKLPPIIIPPPGGQYLSIAGNNCRILISGKETGGAFAAIDMLVPPDGGRGPKAHAFPPLLVCLANCIGT